MNSLEIKMDVDEEQGPLSTMESKVDNSTAAPERDEQLAKIEIGVQAFIFVLAVFGNSCVLIALRYRKKKTSRMHLFIMHLSVADLMVAFFNILPQMAWDITFYFHGNDFLCRSVKYMQVMVIYLSTYVLVMTAIDRYRAICHPLSNYSWTPRRVHIMIAVAWFLALLLSLPQVFIFQYREVKPGHYDCWADFQPEWTVKLYITCFALSIYVLPFCLLAILYGRICFEVWKNVRLKGACPIESPKNGGVVYKFNGTGTISVIAPHNHPIHNQHHHRYHHHNHHKQQQQQLGRPEVQGHVTPRTHSLRGFSRSKMKTIKLTFVVIVAYLVCWSPFFITQMWWAFDTSAPYNSSTFVICLLLASLNSCCNPWIYMAFSGNLIQQLLPCCRKPRQPKYLERVRTAVEVKSDSLTSDDMECQKPENAMIELRKYGMLNRRDTTLSNTSSTKLTRVSAQCNGTHRCNNKACLATRAYQMPLSKRRHVINTNQYRNYLQPKSKDYSKTLFKKAFDKREKSSSSSDKSDRNIFHNSGKKSRKSSSHPGLFFRPFHYEKVELRSTSV